MSSPTVPQPAYCPDPERMAAIKERMQEIRITAQRERALAEADLFTVEHPGAHLMGAI